MQMTDSRANTTLAIGISATLSGTTPSKGNIVDVADYGSAIFALATGVVTDAGDASGFTTQIQESDTTADAAFTAVSDDDLIGLETEFTVTSDAADNAAVGMIGYKGRKRYLRAVLTGSALTNAVVTGVWILQNPRYAPKANVAAPIAAT